MIRVSERSFLPPVAGSASHYASEGVKAFLLLDLDGVFVPDSYSSAPKEWFSLDRSPALYYPNKFYNKELNSRLPRYSREPKSFELRWSEELRNELSQVLSSPDVQAVWVTTWRDDMGGVLEAFGISSARPMVYLPWGEDVRGESHSGKIPAVERFLNEEALPSSTKVAWLDDVALAGLSSDSEMFHQLPASNVLLIKPVSRYGVSREEWHSVRNLIS